MVLGRMSDLAAYLNHCLEERMDLAPRIVEMFLLLLLGVALGVLAVKSHKHTTDLRDALAPQMIQEKPGGKYTCTEQDDGMTSCWSDK